MMKRNILAVVIPALLVAGAANAAEIYNKNGNKLDFYGKMVGEHVWTTNGDTSSDDTTYARIGLKGETQINDQLIGYGQWEYIEVGTWYYFNKNMNVYAAYKFNQLDDNDYTKAAGVATDDQAAVGIVYQF
ncbi:hypothetical protein EWP74_17210 [Klebsiella pneumoniae]|uniref:porin n=1 Tax=Klebsiella pneumoniae TaxID=573 RepID=UPI00113B3544|nr:porin [Klebsiella pneumoniae]TIH62488.1 hypothetical protein EWP74_17210 [Klebsiella pneumoniae]